MHCEGEKCAVTLAAINLRNRKNGRLYGPRMMARREKCRSTGLTGAVMADFTLGTIARLTSPAHVALVAGREVRSSVFLGERNFITYAKIYPKTRRAAVSNLPGLTSTPARGKMLASRFSPVPVHVTLVSKDSKDSKVVVPCRLATIDVKQKGGKRSFHTHCRDRCSHR